MPANARRITPVDILSDADYARHRNALRARAIAAKRNRRVEVGPFATFHFENFETMWLQVHEMLRIEKGGADQLEGELGAYNPLIPQGTELIATLMLEIEDPVRRAQLLLGLGGIEDAVFLEIGTTRIAATPIENEDRTKEDGKTSSIHWLRFSFDAEQIGRFRTGAERVMLGIAHPHYGHIAIVSPAVREELAKDFG